MVTIDWLPPIGYHLLVTLYWLPHLLVTTFVTTFIGYHIYWLPHLVVTIYLLVTLCYYRLLVTIYRLIYVVTF